jgi:signal transduction histidine kinase
MTETVSRLRAKNDWQISWVLAVTGAILAAFFALFAIFQVDRFRYPVLWLPQASHFFLICAGLTIAYMCVARAFWQREPFFLVLGMAWWLPVVIGFMDIVVWPGLVRPLTAFRTAADQDLQVYANFILLFLLLAAQIHRPSIWANMTRLRIVSRNFKWMFAATLLTVGVGMLILFFPDWISAPGTEFPIRSGSLLLLAMSLGAAGLHIYNYQRTGTRINVFLAVLSLIFIFISGAGIMERAIFDGWWFAAISFQMLGTGVVLFAMLEQYSELQAQQDQLGQEVKTIADSSTEIAGMLDLRETSGALLDRCLALTGAKYGFFDLMSDPGELDMVAIRGVGDMECGLPHQPATPFLSRRGFGGWIVQNGAPIVTNDPWSDPRAVGLPESHIPIDSFLGVPLKLRNRVIGVIALANKPGGFAEEDQRAVSTLSAQMAVAVENARLYERIDKELQQKTAEIEALGDISRRLAAATDLDEICSTGMDIVERLFSARAAWISLYNKRTGFLEMRAQRGTDPSRLGELALRPGEGIAGQVFLTGEPLFVPEIATDFRFIYKREMLEQGLASLICVPLRGKQGAIGAMAVHAPKFTADHPPSTAQLGLLGTFASQLAVAIERAELQEEQRREIVDLEALQELSDDAMGAADMQSLLNKVLQVSARIVHANSGVIYFADEEVTFLSARTTFNLGDNTSSNRPGMPVGEGLAGRAVKDRRPARVLDASKHAFSGCTYIAERGICSMVAVPLTYGDKILGAIELGRLSLWHFSDHDVRMLQMMAEKVAIATERAALYEQVQAANSQLTLANARLQEIIDNMPEGVIIIDAVGCVSMTNRAAENLTGRSIPAGMPIENLPKHLNLKTTSGEVFPLSQLPFVRALTGETGSTEIMIDNEGANPTYFVCNAAPLAESGAVYGAVAVLQDVSRLKEIDQLKDSFISMTSHELKNPLTAIIGHVQLMEKRAKSVDNERRGDARNIRVISEQSGRMARLVDELADVSRIQAGRLDLEPKLMDLTSLAERVIEQLQATSEKHEIILATHSSVHGRWDEGRIEQVVHNLLSNAVKYSPDGGIIRVSVERKGSEAQLSVADEGIGIADEQISHLFDRFFRVRDQKAGSAGGMGLGLYICKEIVTRHGGRIWVESRQGKGSTFCFALPGIRATHSAGGPNWNQ